MHWSEFIGGEVVISPPHKWQVRFNASNIEVMPRIDNPVAPGTVDDLLSKFPSSSALTPKVAFPYKNSTPSARPGELSVSLFPLATICQR